MAPGRLVILGIEFKLDVELLGSVRDRGVFPREIALIPTVAVLLPSTRT
jgi:hypothetical protein